MVGVAVVLRFGCSMHQAIVCLFLGSFEWNLPDVTARLALEGFGSVAVAGVLHPLGVRCAALWTGCSVRWRAFGPHNAILKRQAGFVTSNKCRDSLSAGRKRKWRVARSASAGDSAGGSVPEKRSQISRTQRGLASIRY